MEKFPQQSSQPESGNEKERNLRERVRAAAEKVLARVSQATLIVSLAGALNYVATQHTITEHADENGVPTFEHDDPETTAILNYVTGLADITPDQKLILEREYTRRSALSHMMPMPAGIDDMSEEQLIEVVAQIYTHSDTERGPAPNRGGIKKMFELIIPKFQYNEKLYTAIWKLQVRVGAPRVRFLVTNDGFLNDSIKEVRGDYKPHYNPFNNTVYIDTQHLGTTLVSEDAHADQFRNRPLQSVLNYVQSAAHVAYATLGDSKSMKKAYDMEYHRPGSIEYEAHQIIQPRFKREINAAAGETDIIESE